MSGVDVDAEMGAELAALRTEHVALTREHQWLEPGRGDLAAYRAHGLTLRRHHRRLSDFSARLRRDRLASLTSGPAPAVSGVP
jgi:hypothetical protein